MRERRIGVLGATSLIGACLLPMLRQSGREVLAYSRQQVERTNDGVQWCQLTPMEENVRLRSPEGAIQEWICVAPIWVLPQYFDLLQGCGAERVVALSSTSRITKQASTSAKERALAVRMAEAEARLQQWAEECGVDWVILRPTLIYGRGQDRNITEIARFIHRFGFFPVFGNAAGLRQPVHANDVALACVAALEHSGVRARAYDISGGEMLTYREMVVRVFHAMQRPVRLLTVPLWVFRAALALLRVIPRCRHWNTAMAERMSRDLVFDHSEAARDLGFKPRAFALSAEDVSV